MNNDNNLYDLGTHESNDMTVSLSHSDETRPFCTILCDKITVDQNDGHISVYRKTYNNEFILISIFYEYDYYTVTEND
jgi:hypothetical protein